MAIAGQRLRAGRIQRLWAQQFMSFALIGLAPIALAVTHAGHPGSPLPLGDRIVAYVLGGATIVLGVIGMWRCRRLDLRLEGSDAVVRGVARNWRIPLDHVVAVGFGSTFLARSLYLVRADRRAIMARGVSYQGARPAADASDALEAVTAAVEAAGGDLSLWNRDPLPRLPEVPLDQSPDPPQGAVVERISLKPVYRATSSSIAVAALETLVFGVAIQAGLPHAFPWVIVAAAGLVTATTTVSIVAFWRMAPRVRPVVAIAGNHVAVKAGSVWKHFDLTRLAGVGATRVATAPGMFRHPITVDGVRLVDTDGHRLAVDQFVLTDNLQSAVRAHLTTSVVVTAAAQDLLNG